MNDPQNEPRYQDAEEFEADFNERVELDLAKQNALSPNEFAETIESELTSEKPTALEEIIYQARSRDHARAADRRRAAGDKMIAEIEADLASRGQEVS